jgi:hypothetical protein
MGEGGIFSSSFEFIIFVDVLMFSDKEEVTCVGDEYDVHLNL